jgi:hypothetical protein
MESNSNSWLRPILLRLFINRNAIPPYLQIVQTCVEAVLYVAIVNGFQLSSNLFSYNTANITIALILTGLFLARILSGLSLVKFVYIPILAYAFSALNSSTAAIPFLFMVGLLIIIDIVSSVSFDFYSDNLSS